MGTNYNPKIVTDGLVLCLDAANSKSYPGSGNTWIDLSVNGFAGTLINGPTFSGNNSGIITYDGVNDYVQLSSFGTQLGNTNYSIEFMLKVTATSGNYGIMLWGSPGPFNSTGKGIEIRFQTNGFEYTIADGIGTGIRTQYNFSNIADGSWRHFVITQVIGGNSILYVNAVQVATTSYSGENSFTDTYALQIGKGNDGYLNGQIGIFKIYNKVLSIDEVNINFSAVRGRYGI